MADPAEFSAAELDQLEDALEGVEFARSGDAAPHLRRRLDDYRNILALSRAAMPVVDVPHGLLDGVLAQARASVEVASITPSVDVAERPGFWSRLRRFAVLPGVALAGTAAIVLFMVERKPQTEAAVVSTGPVSAADAPVVGERSDDKRAAKNQATSSPAAPPPGGVAPTEPAMAEVAAAAEPESPPPSPAPAADAKPSKGGGKDSLAKEEVDGDEAQIQGLASEKKLADSDTPRWDIIARGDRARHRGDCDAARSEYALALDDMDSRVRSRAHAGLGLCEAVRGDRSSADAAYKVARELDAEIVTFIDDERPRGTAGSAAKAKPKAASKKTSDVSGATPDNASPLE